MSDDNRIPTETVMSDWAADNRILDAAMEAALDCVDPADRDEE